MSRVDAQAIEILAGAEHASWARWQEYLFSRCTPGADGSMTIPPELVDRWARQIKTMYPNLTESEKQSDRNEVERALEMLDAAGYAIVPKDSQP